MVSGVGVVVIVQWLKHFTPDYESLGLNPYRDTGIIPKVEVLTKIIPIDLFVELGYLL